MSDPITFVDELTEFSDVDIAKVRGVNLARDMKVDAAKVV